MSIPGSATPLLLATTAAGPAAAYQIDRSLRFNKPDSAYLSRDMSSASSTYTFSTWIKRTDISGSDFQYIFASGAGGIAIHTSNTFYVFDGSPVQQTTGVYRDPSAWYHLVFSVNSGSFTLYVNGVSVKTGTAASLSTTANATSIGRYMGTGSPIYYLNAYLAEIHFVDGTALTATDFGEYDDNNVWQPKEFAGSYGTNGFHLDFSDNSSNAALGTDSSGSSNDWTVNNLSVASGAGNDSLIDTPTNYTAASGNNGGNYCTLNPLESALTGLNNGNLNSGSSGAASWKICTSTLAVSSGKYYWEGFTDTTADSSKGWQFGFCQVGPSSLTTPYGTGKWSYQAGNIYNQSSTATSVGTTAVANDLLAYALDMDAGTCKLYVNNSLVHTFTGITGTITPFVGSYNTPTVTVNFGQRPFAYTPPTNHLSLCTTNLPDPTIADGSTAFEALAYIGDGGTSRSISSLNFSPDLVWFKNRGTLNYHQLHDIVRGATKRIYTNATEAENTYTTALTSFDSNGWTMSNGTPCNANNNSYIAWTWDAGTSTVSNTDGSITSTVRANASAGFSIVSVSTDGTNTIRTAGHGLNAVPYFIISKNRDFVDNWFVYHKDIQTDNKQRLNLNTTGAVDSSGSLIWAHTSSVIGFNGAQYVGSSTDDLIFYCWAPVAGYSAFGSFEASSSADGPFVYTGFRSRFLLIKNADDTTYASSYSWVMIDTERYPNNEAAGSLNPLYANRNAIENVYGPGSGVASQLALDILSNGFKPRCPNAELNNGNTYIYAAFAEHPFKYSRAR